MEFLTAKQMSDIHEKKTFTKEEAKFTQEILDNILKIANNPFIQDKYIKVEFSVVSKDNFNLRKINDYLNINLGYESSLVLTVSEIKFSGYFSITWYSDDEKRFGDLHQLLIDIARGNIDPDDFAKINMEEIVNEYNTLKERIPNEN